MNLTCGSNTVENIQTVTEHMKKMKHTQEPLYFKLNRNLRNPPRNQQALVEETR